MPDLALLRAPRAGLVNTLLRSLLVLSLHLLILFFVLRSSGVLSRPASAPAPVFLSLISSLPEKPAPPVAQTVTPAKAPALHVPVIAALAPSNNTPALNPANLPAPATTLASVPAPVGVAPAEPPVVTEARFDAAYLNNPAPSYPLISRRNGEAGKVLLLVQVSKNGAAAQVEISQSCGYARLDQAALEAVRQWRFVPARRGDEAIAASVLVPLTFRLNS